MALESSCLPIPSEIVMPFAGYLASTGRFHLLLVAIAGAVGCNIGSTFIYYLGATGGRALVEKWGHYLFLTPAKLDRVDRYFARWGSETVFFSRLLPMIPVVVSFPAGIARMPMWKFQIYTFAGCFIWCFVLAWLGFEFGRAWQSTPWVKSAMHGFNIAMVIVVTLALAWFAWRFWRGRRPA
jgi:membrane protein DedA with SNARE-associated domain